MNKKYQVPFKILDIFINVINYACASFQEYLACTLADVAWMF